MAMRSSQSRTQFRDPRFPLTILRLLLPLILSSRPCAARQDPGGGPVGMHQSKCKLCLPVALPVSAVAAAALITLLVCICRRRRSSGAAVTAAGDREGVDDPKVPSTWLPGLRSSRPPPPDNPMSINPTMVRSPITTPARFPISPQMATTSPVTGHHRSQSRAQSSPLRPGPRAQSSAKQKKQQDPLACYSPVISVQLTELAYERLESATDGFGSESRLGHRGGPWQAVFTDTKFVQNNGLPTTVVLKRYHSIFSEEDCKRIREELKCKYTLRHKNLVSLHGFSLGKGRLYLVYDYIPNGSLEKHLFPDAGGPVLDWGLRYGIVKDIAQGLDQLYVSNTCHRSITTSSIMLDNDYTARIDDHFDYRPDVTGGGGGGASAPADDSLDLGALILEIVCGRRRTAAAVGNATMPLVDCGGEERLIHAVDPRLQGEINRAQASKLLLLGLACSHPDPTLRMNISDARRILLDLKRMPQLPST
ncbi:hypothetical protein ACP70R_033173 [Stipagrostis hirtigluma subsp. patula]